MILLRSPWFMMILIVTVIAGICSRCPAQEKLSRYTTKYYILHTDLDRDMTRQAIVRTTAMAREYYNRTKSFSGLIQTRFPFYLYKDRKDYLKHPGIVKGSTGVYDGKSLVVIAPKPGGSWSIVQHEGFHQFAHKMIQGRLPTWLNEGMAEYFGYGIWTGDNLVVGVISPRLLKRVRGMISDKKLIPLDKMLEMTQKEWNSKLEKRNYLQAWSMVHFLVHADKGKYQKALSDYIRDLSQGRSASLAFRERFGDNVKAFQDRYIQWWNGLKDNPTAELYDKIKVLTLTSYLARAYHTRMKFENIAAFFRAAHDGTFKKVFALIGKYKPEIWLPESLLKTTIKSSGDIKQWSLIRQKDRPVRLKYTRSDKPALIGSFTIDTDSKITVTVKKVVPAPKPTVKQSAQEKTSRLSVPVLGR
ncbi:MAG: DUF1570 domain-containing protein [bacterium]|nr:DUF1570 domain-containing protein [bacterium]